MTILCQGRSMSITGALGRWMKSGISLEDWCTKSGDAWISATTALFTVWITSFPTLSHWQSLLFEDRHNDPVGWAISSCDWQIGRETVRSEGLEFLPSLYWVRWKSGGGAVDNCHWCELYIMVFGLQVTILACQCMPSYLQVGKMWLHLYMTSWGGSLQLVGWLVEKDF